MLGNQLQGGGPIKKVEGALLPKDHPTYLSVVADNSTKSSAVTAPSVASAMARKESRDGKRVPFLHRVTVTRETPIIMAKSPSGIALLERNSSSFIGTMYRLGTFRSRVLCTKSADDSQNDIGHCRTMDQRPNRIAEWRVTRGLTQAELADRCNTTHATIGRLENGRRGLSEKWLRLLSKALRVEPADLLKSQHQEALEADTADAMEVLASLPPEKRKQWIELGQALRLQQEAS